MPCDPWPDTSPTRPADTGSLPSSDTPLTYLPSPPWLTIGPLVIALVLLPNGDYRTGYALLAISAVLALACVIVGRVNFPLPTALEQGRTAPATGFTPSYWLYMVAGAFFAAGLMSFELISYHLSTTKVVGDHWIPVFLAISTAFGVIASLVLGKLYDQIGLPAVLVAVFLSALFSPFVFLGGFYVALFGMLLWGIGYATQDTLLKAVVAGVLPEGQRNLAFGLYLHGLRRRMADRQCGDRAAL
jgi:predicted MFS family arabinose efflux permease